MSCARATFQSTMSQMALSSTPSILSRLATCTLPMPPTPTKPMRTRSSGGAANSVPPAGAGVCADAPGASAMPSPMAAVVWRNSRRVWSVMSAPGSVACSFVTIRRNWCAVTRRTRGPCGLVLVLFLLVSGPLSATQGASDPIARAHVVTTPPIIDGRLTDPVWQTVEPVTGFVQRELHEGQPVTERTEVRIVTDGQALYVGAWLYDTDPSGIVPGEKVRDGDISKSDYFGILLDTYHDRQTGGLTLVRSIRRKNEESFWSFVPRQFSLMKISHAGTLTGVHVPARRVLTATPYALTGVERNFAVDPEAKSRSDVGGEIKYGVTPSLTLDLT